jgi:hypothetical protein
MAPEVARFWDARVNAEPPPIAGAVREGDGWTIEVEGLDGLMNLCRDESGDVIISTAKNDELPMLIIEDALASTRKAFMDRMRKLSPLEGH